MALVGYIVVFGGGTTWKAFADCNPRPKQVAVFQDHNFQGNYRLLSIGQYPHGDNIGLGCTDCITSIKVGAAVQAVLCDDGSYLGTCQLFTADDPTLSDDRVDSDTVSSIKVQPRGFQDCRPSADRVALFTATSYTGRCVTKAVGEYPHGSDIGLQCTDCISSIKVGANMWAGLFPHANYGCERLGVDCQAFFEDSKELDDRLNEQVSSVVVGRRARVLLKQGIFVLGPPPIPGPAHARVFEAFDARHESPAPPVLGRG